MIDDRLLEGATSILKGMVKHYRPVASAHPSVRKGANFSRTDNLRCWVGEWSEKSEFLC